MTDLNSDLLELGVVEYPEKEAKKVGRKKKVTEEEVTEVTEEVTE